MPKRGNNNNKNSSTSAAAAPSSSSSSSLEKTRDQGLAASKENLSGKQQNLESKQDFSREDKKDLSSSSKPQQQQQQQQDQGDLSKKEDKDKNLSSSKPKQQEQQGDLSSQKDKDFSSSKPQQQKQQDQGDLGKEEGKDSGSEEKEGQGEGEEQEGGGGSLLSTVTHAGATVAKAALLGSVAAVSTAAGLLIHGGVGGGGNKEEEEGDEAKEGGEEGGSSKNLEEGESQPQEESDETLRDKILHAGAAVAKAAWLGGVAGVSTAAGVLRHGGSGGGAKEGEEDEEGGEEGEGGQKEGEGEGEGGAKRLDKGGEQLEEEGEKKEGGAELKQEGGAKQLDKRGEQQLQGASTDLSDKTELKKGGSSAKKGLSDQGDKKLSGGKDLSAEQLSSEDKGLLPQAESESKPGEGAKELGTDKDKGQKLQGSKADYGKKKSELAAEKTESKPPSSQELSAGAGSGGSGAQTLEPKPLGKTQKKKIKGLKEGLQADKPRAADNKALDSFPSEAAEALPKRLEANLTKKMDKPAALGDSDRPSDLSFNKNASAAVDQQPTTEANRLQKKFPKQQEQDRSETTGLRDSDFSRIAGDKKALDSGFGGGPALDKQEKKECPKSKDLKPMDTLKKDPTKGLDMKSHDIPAQKPLQKKKPKNRLPQQPAALDKPEIEGSFTGASVETKQDKDKHLKSIKKLPGSEEKVDRGDKPLDVTSKETAGGETDTMMNTYMLGTTRDHGNDGTDGIYPSVTVHRGPDLSQGDKGYSGHSIAHKTAQGGLVEQVLEEGETLAPGSKIGGLPGSEASHIKTYSGETMEQKGHLPASKGDNSLPPKESIGGTPVKDVASAETTKNLSKARV